MTVRFLRFMQVNNLLEPGSKTILAVSGGVDSMTLVSLFAECRLPMAIAHCNFMLREKESDRDERFVEKTAQKLKIPHFVKKFDTSRYAHENHLSLQMAARELRYQWFRELMNSGEYQAVATAHHLDDQIESFFINLFRGTGIRGLKGIPVKQDLIFRPMLEFTRKEILDYAREHKIRYCADSSNDELHYLRNQIRHLLIPVLEQIQPQYQVVMSNTFHRLKEESTLLWNILDQKKEKLCSLSGKQWTINIPGLLQEPQVSLLLSVFLEPCGFTSKQIGMIEASLTGQSGKQFHSPKYRLVKNREELILSPVTRKPNDEIILLTDKGDRFSYHSRKGNLHMNFVKGDVNATFTIDPRPSVACLDLDKIRFPLQLRPWVPGDAFTPLGMKGKKKISDFLTDLKLSLLQKEKTCVLCSGDQIIWVVGHRIDHRVRITSKTKKYCMISLSGT